MLVCLRDGTRQDESMLDYGVYDCMWRGRERNPKSAHRILIGEAKAITRFIARTYTKHASRPAGVSEHFVCNSRAVMIFTKSN